MDEPAFHRLTPEVVDFDPRIHEDLEAIEMANLREGDTGVPGTMYVSSAQGSHGPRTKWFPGRGGTDIPCLTITIADPPIVINHNLSERDSRRGSDPARRWTVLNAAALLTFWHVGSTWDRHELNAFLDGLQKLP